MFRLLNDSLAFGNITSSQFKIAKFEEIALDPLGQFNEISEFFNMSVPPEAARFVSEHGNAG